MDDVLQEITRLVREEPTLTVRELARRLGYAEEGSVYYWLRKAGFRGIQDLRRAVLGGREAREPLSPWPQQVREGEPSLPSVPFFADSGDTPAERLVVHLPVSPRSFARRVQTGEYAPYLLSDDIVVVDPRGAFRDGDLAFVEDATGRSLLRRFLGPGPAYWVHPTDPHAAPLPGPALTLVGKVVEVIRLYR